MSLNDLKHSSERIGKLYPILVDHDGTIIDGAHRIRADQNWPVLRLDNIKTEKDRLIAKIVSNVVRRNVPPKEKTALLDSLGQTYFNDGVKLGRIAYAIAEETGMSYRWVAKYLSLKFKNDFQSSRASSAACRAARVMDEFLKPPTRKSALFVRSYNNTKFVSLILEKDFYDEFKRYSLDLGVPPEFSIIKALEEYQAKLKQAVMIKNGAEQIDDRKNLILQGQPIERTSNPGR